MELPIAIFIHNTVCWWDLRPAASQETVLIQCGVLQAVCLRVMEYVHTYSLAGLHVESLYLLSIQRIPNRG